MKMAQTQEEDRERFQKGDVSINVSRSKENARASGIVPVLSNEQDVTRYIRSDEDKIFSKQQVSIQKGKKNNMSSVRLALTKSNPKNLAHELTNGYACEVLVKDTGNTEFAKCSVFENSFIKAHNQTQSYLPENMLSLSSIFQP